MGEAIIAADGFFDQDPKHTGRIEVWPLKIVWTRDDGHPKVGSKTSEPAGDRAVVPVGQVVSVLVYHGQVASQVAVKVSGVAPLAWYTSDRGVADRVLAAIEELL